MSLESTIGLAKKIKCFGIAAALETRLAEAKANQFEMEELLNRLLHDEVADRLEKTTRRMLTRARFRHQYSLEDWDTSYDRGLSKLKLKELAKLSFWQNRENLIILGSTGSGKSHLAVALGRRICSMETSVRFFSTNMFFDEVAAARSAGRYLVFLRSLAHVAVLVFDDFALRQYSHDEATILMDLLEDRYQKGILIITSQVNPTGWKSLFLDPVIAEAIVDRLINPSQQIILKGESYRTKLKPKSIETTASQSVEK